MLICHLEPAVPKAVMTFLLHMDRPSIDKKPPYPLTVTRPLTKPKNSLFKQKDRYIDKSNNENHSRSQSMISLCRCFQTSQFNETLSSYIYCNNPSFLEDIMVSRRTDSTSIRTYLCTAILHDHESPIFTAKCPTNWTDIDEILISSRRPNRSYGKIQ